MTRKDFVMIAKIIKAYRSYTPNLIVDNMARDFADVLRSTNPEFKRERFLTACGCGD